MHHLALRRRPRKPYFVALSASLSAPPSLGFLCSPPPAIASRIPAAVLVEVEGGEGVAWRSYLQPGLLVGQWREDAERAPESAGEAVHRMYVCAT